MRCERDGSCSALSRSARLGSDIKQVVVVGFPWAAGLVVGLPRPPNASGAPSDEAFSTDDEPLTNHA